MCDGLDKAEVLQLCGLCAIRSVALFGSWVFGKLIFLKVEFIRMRLLLLGFLVRLTLSCDPVTQYESGNGQCCKKCGPGTRMSSYDVSCQDPQCTPCGDNEYQESYTRETRCKLQKYCDPNKHFVYMDVAGKSKTERIQCICETGYHCSSSECIICVQHTQCGPGHMVKSIGDHDRDTVCEKCPPGTFSVSNSHDSKCQEWTVCHNGLKVKANGTATSNTVCETKEKQQGVNGVLVIIVVLVIIIILLLAAFAFIMYKFKDNPGGVRGRFQDCMDSCLKKEAKALPPADQPDNAHVVCNIGLPQEEQTLSLPEENELERNGEETQKPLITDNGNLLVQEDGKKEALSRQESQTYSV